jgi:hypothetical protein
VLAAVGVERRDPLTALQTGSKRGVALQSDPNPEATVSHTHKKQRQQACGAPEAREQARTRAFGGLSGSRRALHHVRV